MKDIIQALLKASHRHLFIGLDRDGTLVPYASSPERAVPDAQLRSLLLKLSSTPGVTTAIISARSIAQLKTDFGDQSIILAGNYGLEIMLPGGKTIVQKRALEAMDSLKQARHFLSKLVDYGTEAILEDHGYSICLHWHTVSQEDIGIVHKTVEEAAQKFAKLKLRALPTSYELLPGINWDKSRALDIVSAEAINLKHDQCFYVFAGDSEADVPAFNWVNERQGISIKVGRQVFESGALFQLPDSLKLRELLHVILQLRSKGSS